MEEGRASAAGLPSKKWSCKITGFNTFLFANANLSLRNIALVLQRFQLEMADPSYELQLKSTLTIKPWHFRMKVRRRPGKNLMTGIPGGVPSQAAQKHKDQHEQAHRPRADDGEKKQVSVFFGGETGTCESLAQSLLEKAPEYGLQIDVQGLDSATENVSADRPSIIITSSYEGNPPGNAKSFVCWLERLASTSVKLPKVIYAVYGVGNSDWASTFHRIPKLVDDTISKLGGERIVEAGYSDVKTDLVGPWEDWSEKLLQALSGGKGAVDSTPGVEVSIQNSKLSQTLGGEEMTIGTVVSNYELADTTVGPAKRHMDVRLPEGSPYTAGDYLVVQACNPDETVRRALVRFGMHEHAMMRVKGSKKKFLPIEPTSVHDFLLDTVELAIPITKRQLGTLVSHAEAGSLERKSLQAMQEEPKYQELLAKRYSILDILEEYPDLDLPFGVYIDMLQPLTPRQYSISSSPLHPDNNPAHKDFADIASVTYDIHESSAMSGHGTFHGVASSYLASRRPGDKISCFVRPTSIGFRMPGNTETPIIMIAAGTGIAPMRAFLQERAALKDAGARKLGPAMLFFGCRNETKDFIYKDELEKWERQGIVEIKTAFSRPDQGEKKHVNEVFQGDQDRVAELFRAGGKIYLCGSASRLGRSTAEACKSVYRAKSGKSAKEAEEWLDQVKVDRYVSDVY